MNNIDKALLQLKRNYKQISQNQANYYNDRRDAQYTKRYYRNLHLPKNNRHQAFLYLHRLLRKTHKTQLPYFMSKDDYLYTWVDLQPDGTIKNIYSGESKDPSLLIADDYEAQHSPQAHVGTEHAKFNAEHIVPQSWFGAREPMKGDLHHLFACDPKCNRSRSNFPYKDFSFYEPESPNEPIRNHCGVAFNDYFEPEYGKGTVARAMLYFITRYPNEIKSLYSRRINIHLLRKWNTQFPPDMYEKHRNQAIYLIQGNRNPFIDYPKWAERVFFPL